MIIHFNCCSSCTEEYGNLLKSQFQNLAECLRSSKLILSVTITPKYSLHRIHNNCSYSQNAIKMFVRCTIYEICVNSLYHFCINQIFCYVLCVIIFIVWRKIVGSYNSLVGHRRIFTKTNFWTLHWDRQKFVLGTIRNLLKAQRMQSFLLNPELPELPPSFIEY